MTASCFDVTMGSFDGAEIYELVVLYIQSKLEKILPKSNFRLYWDGGLTLGKLRKQLSEYLKIWF